MYYNAKASQWPARPSGRIVGPEVTVKAGTFWGVLNVSLCASGTWLRLDLTCFVNCHPSVICHPSFVICHSSTVIHHPSTVNRHPPWKKLDVDEI